MSVTCDGFYRAWLQHTVLSLERSHPCSDRAEATDAAPPQSSAADFFDGATRTFWRNVQARGTGAQPPPLGRRPARWALPDEVRWGKFGALRLQQK